MARSRFCTFTWRLLQLHAAGGGRELVLRHHDLRRLGGVDGVRLLHPLDAVERVEHDRLPVGGMIGRDPQQLTGLRGRFRPAYVWSQMNPTLCPPSAACPSSSSPASRSWRRPAAPPPSRRSHHGGTGSELPDGRRRGDSTPRIASIRPRKIAARSVGRGSWKTVETTRNGMNETTIAGNGARHTSRMRRARRSRGSRPARRRRAAPGAFTGSYGSTSAPSGRGRR